MNISLLLVAVIFFAVGLPSCLSADQRYDDCRLPLRCGLNPSMFRELITYPFWGNEIGRPDFCGQSQFEISCKDNEIPTLEIGNFSLRIVSADLEKHIIRVADESLFDGGCPEIWNFRGENQYSLDSSNDNIDIYNCSASYEQPPSSSSIACERSLGNRLLVTYYVFPPSVDKFPNCTKVGEIPMLQSVKNNLHNQSSNLPLEEALKQGFDLKYSIEDQNCRDCIISEGICGSDSKTKRFQCLCEDKPHKISCAINDEDSTNMGKKIIIGASAGVLGLATASIAWYLYHRKQTKSYRTSSALFERNISSDPSSKSSDIEKAEELLAGIRLFSYAELEEATNNFDPSKELGDGGFGTVYYGKLKDGRSVAVKRLYDNNFKRAEQFRNEVEIIARLRHPNLVALFGCSSKQSRDLLLVYEYVANGTLADHLHGSHASSRSLPWSTRLKIAVETASALKYLHASKIIHRDVKTNNILLDQNFNVKVADFGLSRLFPTDKTHVSTAPQGTPGYVDPDYHQCYQLSNKSDVYSFAVVLMELISSMPAVDITRCRQEINLSNMAVVKIQNHKLHEMVDPSLGFDTDTRVRQTVTAVAELAFQCLQSDKDLRPCMSHVQETLTKIQNNGFSQDKNGVGDDDVVGTKSGRLTAESPDTVIMNWDSK